MQRQWILGAPDPEMYEIERVLMVHREYVMHATSAGVRVSAGNAHYADPPAVDYTKEVYAVECRWRGMPRTVRIIGHHGPGDPGYEMPPAKYMSASSLGQVLAVLGVEPAPVQRLIAAADHCLAAAYRGECPGVDREELRQWRVRTRAKHQRRQVREIEEMVAAAISTLRAAPRITIAGEQVANLLYAGYVPELPEAAAQIGQAFVSRLKERDSEKLVLQCAAPETVRVWMHDQAAMGRRTYGDPMRGFAGAYLAQGGA